MAGRSRQAVAVLQAGGRKHMTKEEQAARAEAEVSVPEGEFRPPDTLTEAQAEEFQEIALWMQDVNARNRPRGAIYCDRDSEGIAQYIVCKDLAHGYQRRLERARRKGEPAKERALAQLHLRYCEMARKYSADIGLDYISRMKRAGPVPGRDGGGDYGGF